jgi:hypothetical protein
MVGAPETRRSTSSPSPPDADAEGKIPASTTSHPKKSLRHVVKRSATASNLNGSDAAKEKILVHAAALEKSRKRKLARIARKFPWTTN